MDIRKIAVVGGFAVAAALTSAPLASADGLTTTVDSEISSLNSLYETDASLAGVSSDLTTPVDAPGVLDTILPADIDTVQGDGSTFFDSLVYGLSAPLLELDPAPGAQDLANGAIVEFDDAYNTLASLPLGYEDVPVGDLLGVDDAILDASGVDADPALFVTFVQTGISDLVAGLFAVQLDNL